MNLIEDVDETVEPSIPRVSGGEPMREQKYFPSRMYSPRERG